MTQKQRPGEKIKLISVDELLGVNNEESAIDLKIDEIVAFQDHPFKVQDDEKMEELVNSIKHNGILTPVLVRPTADNRYEMISGHRRMHAAKLLGLEVIPAFIRELSDDDATVVMVDSNLQREELLPSEKAFAYKMKYEAMRHQGERRDLKASSQNGTKSEKTTSSQNETKSKKNTSSQNGTRFRADIALAEQIGESRNQLQRYIRLTELIPEILELVDLKRMPMVTAVDISFIPKQIQKYIYEYIKDNGMVKSYQVTALRKHLESEDTISQAAMIRLLNDNLPGKTPAKKVTFTEKKLRKYFPPMYSSADMEKIILRLIEEWAAEQEGGSDEV